MKEPFSLTTTLPYVNSDPHVGFALEIVQADVVARYHRLIGDEVFFNTGTDEHGIKIYRKAEEAGQDPQDYVDVYAKRFGLLKEKLDLSYDAFIRTTDPHHVKAAQEFWKICEKNGDIYKKHYQVKYCVGCELEKTDSELEDGKCPIHPNLKIELIEEENYFFKFSNYQKKLLELYESRPDFVVPDYRFNEIKSFMKSGLQDFSISRLKEKMPWGVPVPGDETQVMYVWFDALVNYISTLGWPNEEYVKWWPSVQFAGKDNLRQQSAMWQAMLMSAGIEPSKQIMIHGFITSGGHKMSKSLGNVINPIAVVDEYGTDELRYFLLRHINPFEDSDFTMERFHECYTANLVNGLGNLVSRVMKLAETHLDTPIEQPKPAVFSEDYTKAIENYEFNVAMDYIWKRIGDADQRMTDEAPFKVVKTDLEEGKRIIAELVLEVYQIGRLLNPFMPETNRLIKETVLANKKTGNNVSTNRLCMKMQPDQLRVVTNINGFCVGVITTFVVFAMGVLSYEYLTGFGTPLLGKVVTVCIFLVPLIASYFASLRFFDKVNTKTRARWLSVYAALLAIPLLMITLLTTTVGY